MAVDKKKLDERTHEVKLKRGEIAIAFAFIEGVINRVIASHYLGRESETFTAEVLEDEYFSFGLKSKILKKICRGSYPDFPTGKLQELGRIRNIITHSVLKMAGEVNLNSNDIVGVGEMAFRHGGKDHDIDELFNKFDKLGAEIKSELAKLPGGSTIQVNVPTPSEQDSARQEGAE